MSRGWPRSGCPNLRVKLGIQVQTLGVREPDDFEAAFASMTREKPYGIMMVTDVLTVLNRKRVFEFAAVHRIHGDV
jgi:putative ABC transport system substrate-binding protein